MSLISIRSVAGTLALLAGLSSARAADSPQNTGAVEEIIVTAQRREETVQNVPLSITALSARALQEKAVTSFFDYAGQVPGLAFGYTGDGSGTARTISIRGISGDGATGFYIDETPVPDSIDPRVVDLQRIEALRGPQGTLYGARSMGGTVRLITQQPNLSDFEGWAKANGSHTLNADTANYGLDAAVNLPLIADRMALRLVGFAQHEGGFFQPRFLANPAAVANLPPNANPTALNGLATSTVKDVGRTNSFGGAASLLIRLGSAVSVTPRVLFQKSDANGLEYTDVGAYPVPTPAPPAISMHPAGFTQYRFFNLPESSHDRWTLASVAVKWETGFGVLTSSTSYLNRTVDETEDETDFLWQNLLAPYDGVPLPNGSAYHAVPIASTIEELKQIHEFVEEVRFVSHLSGPLQYVAGAFFSDTRGRVPYAGYYPPALAPGISQTAGVLTIGIPVNPANPDEIFGQDYQTRVSEPAVYGEVSYLFTDALKATVGLRGYQIRTESGGYLEGLAFGGARLTDPQASFTEHGVNPKAEVDYHIDADKMIYGLAARGFRPGGLVPSIPGNSAVDPLGCFAQLQALGYTSAAQTKSYKSDHLWNFEAGAKTDWADHRMTLNGSVFYIDWRANAGAAVSKGFDLDLHTRVVENLDLSAGVGYQRARITETSPASPQQVGDRVYQVPDWTGTASATYRIPLAGERSVVATAGYSYTGSSRSASVTAAQPRVRPGYSVLDARIAYVFGGQEVALVGKNLTNVEANLADNRSLAAETLGRPRLVINQPLTIGVEFRASF
ncbi:MAG: TonB-dependent receptor [Gammaproteobacteria bacterium]|nr:MAG: TonB-dependent receptor [Gammaproteobacteria bacterium]